MKTQPSRRLLARIAMITVASVTLAPPSSGCAGHPDPVLEWNQIFIDTLIATNTAHSSSQRLGAIIHTAVFDAYNGIERRYTPVLFHGTAPPGTSRRAAVIAAAYTALVSLFPSRKSELDAAYTASLAALSDDGEDGGQSRERGIAWGRAVADAVLAWRVTDGFSASYPPFTGGTAVGQWRPTPPAFGPMSAQGLAFTSPFIVVNNARFRPDPPRGLGSSTYVEDFNTVKALGRTPVPHVLMIRRRLRPSGRATPASTGIRRQTRLRAPITCRSPKATGFLLF